MTQFRVSRALCKIGVSEADQHYIFGECMRKKTAEQQEQIRQLCIEIAGEWGDALCRFLTDPYINHVYICMEYHIPKDLLFELKRKYYVVRKDKL